MKDDSSLLIHWVEWTDMKSTRAQHGASSLVKEFVLWGTGGTVQRCHCWDKVGSISYLFSLVLMDK